MAKNYKHFLLAGLSGLLLALAYPGWRIDLGFLVWIALIPLLFAVQKLVDKPDRNNKQSFALGFFTGLIYFLIIFRWFWAIYPLDTLGIQSKPLSFVIILLTYLISSSGMAVFWGLASTTLYRQLALTNNREDRKPLFSVNWLAAPAIFTFFEYISSWGFGFLWAGSGSLFGPHWTLGNLAYSLADSTTALKISSYAGIYGIAFVIVLVNWLIHSSVARRFTGFNKLFATKIALAGLLIIAITFGPKLIKPLPTLLGNNKKINFAIIQTAQQTSLSPSPQESLIGLKEQLELLNLVAKNHPESKIVVFPEASDLFKNIALFLTPTQTQRYFANLFKESKLIIAGGRIIDSQGQAPSTSSGQAYSRVFDLDTQKGIVNYYDKRLLAPGGEFIPYTIKLLAFLFSKFVHSGFDDIQELSVNLKKPSTFNFGGDLDVAPMICSELLSPSLTKQTTQGSNLIVSMASYGTFHGNSTIAKQMLAATRFRAAENARPVIAAVNLGQSYAIDSSGNIALISSDKGHEILTGSIVLGSSKTWYNKLGDLPIILASLLLMVNLTLLIWFRSHWRP